MPPGVPRLYTQYNDHTAAAISPAQVTLIFSAIVPALLVIITKSAVNVVAVLAVNCANSFTHDCNVATPLVAYPLNAIPAALFVVVLVFITWTDLVASDAARSVEALELVIPIVGAAQDNIDNTVNSRFIKGIW